MGDDEAAEQLQVLAVTLERLEELRPYPEGLFRVPAPRDEVHELATALLRDEPMAAREALRACRDAYTCADALKQWLRARPVLPAAGELRETMEATAAVAADGAATAAHAQTVAVARAAREDMVRALGALPSVSQATVEAVLRLLRDVTKSASAAMQARSLAICLAPSFFDGSRIAAHHDGGSEEEQRRTNAADVKILHCLLFEPAAEAAFDDSQPLVLSEVVRAGPAMLRDLLRSGKITDINATLEDKWTLLHWSARLGAHHCAKLLLEHGADVRIGDWSKYTALHVAATVEVADVLLQCCSANAALRMRNMAGRTALEEHAEEGRTAVAEMLRRAEPRMLVARQQRLAWAKAGTHRRLAAATSPAFRCLPDDIVIEVGRRLPLIFRQTPADQAAVKAADPRMQPVHNCMDPVAPDVGHSGRQNCVVQ